MWKKTWEEEQESVPKKQTRKKVEMEKPSGFTWGKPEENISIFT